MSVISLLLVALLFGGMVLFSFGFAAFVFTHLPQAQAGPLIRAAFPHFYTWCMAVALTGAVVSFWVSPLVSCLLSVVFLTTLPTRQLLMPAVNRATDSGDNTRFKRLHSASVAVTVVHIAIAAFCLSRFL